MDDVLPPVLFRAMEMAPPALGGLEILAAALADNCGGGAGIVPTAFQSIGATAERLRS